MKYIITSLVLFIVMNGPAFAQAQSSLSVTITSDLIPGTCIISRDILYITATVSGGTGTTVQYQLQTSADALTWTNKPNGNHAVDTISYEAISGGHIWLRMKAKEANDDWKISNSININKCCVLDIPVHISFTGRDTDDGALFFYSTSVDSRKFLEVSHDNGHTFHQVKEVDSTRCIDSMFSETSLYRLRVVPLEGPHVEEIKYSATITVIKHIPCTDNKNITIYPNPTADYFKIKGITEPVYLYLYDTYGRECKRAGVIGDAKITIGDLQRGMYVCKIFDRTTGRKLASRQLLKL